MAKIVVQNWQGEGALEIDGVEYPVTYRLRYESNGNVRSTTGILDGLPAKFLVSPPQNDRLPLALANGDVVEVAVFGGDPCRVRVNSAMPGVD